MSPPAQADRIHVRRTHMSTGDLTSFEMARTEQTTTSTFGGTPVSVAVVEAIAEDRGIDPLDVEPLWNAVDSEALDRLFANSATTDGGQLSVSFRFDDRLVTVDGDGTITTRPARKPAQTD